MKCAQCVYDATWNGRCPHHGGMPPSVPELMTLLGKLTGWGDQSLSVDIGYKRRRDYDEHADSYLNDRAWGFTAGTKVCGQSQDVHAQGPTLEEALWALCNETMQQILRVKSRGEARAAEADRALDEFLRARHVP